MKRFAEIFSAAVLMLAVAGPVPASAQDGKGDGNKDRSYASSFFKVGVKGGIDFISMSRIYIRIGEQLHGLYRRRGIQFRHAAEGDDDTAGAQLCLKRYDVQREKS